MNDFSLEPLGKILLFIGLFLMVLGAVILLGSKIPFIGRLPGDIIIQRKNFTFYFPITTLILLNLLLLLISWLLRKL